MIPAYLSPLANHLWQSTIFAGAVVLLTLVLKTNRAQARYWLWLAASVKFLIPFSLLVTTGPLRSFHFHRGPGAARSKTRAHQRSCGDHRHRPRREGLRELSRGARSISICPRRNLISTVTHP